MHRRLLLFPMLLATNFLFAQDVAFTISEKDLIPEGIAYDPVTERFFVSSTYKRKIIEVEKRTGKWKEFIAEGEDRIPGVIGMRVDAKRRHLWACAATAGEGMPVRGLESVTNQTALYQYDLRSGKLIQKFLIENDTVFHFLNDVAVAPDGKVYVTDTGAGRIYSTNNTTGKLELFVQLDGYMPNGIDWTSDRDLVVAVYGNPNALIRLDPKTKQVSVITLPPNEKVTADGLYFYKNSLIAVQPNNPQRVIMRYNFKIKTEINEIVSLGNQNHPVFFQPTTGVIVADEFYFIANSQLQHFRKMFAEGKGKYPMNALRDVVIMKVKLE
jgi:hypothetical protein